MSEPTRVTTTCKKCGAEILWANHVGTGKPAPIDWEPTEGGNVLINRDGTYRILSKLEYAAELHTNHFATCPDADALRHRQ